MGEKPSLEQLRQANRLHRTELRKLEKMSETQFQAFKRNFSVGQLANMTQIEAVELLRSMLTLNLKLQGEMEGTRNDP